MTRKINSWHITTLIAAALTVCHAPNTQRAVVRYDQQRLSCTAGGAVQPAAGGGDQDMSALDPPEKLPHY